LPSQLPLAALSSELCSSLSHINHHGVVITGKMKNARETLIKLRLNYNMLFIIVHSNHKVPLNAIVIVQYLPHYCVFSNDVGRVTERDLLLLSSTPCTISTEMY
jgi:hypothetical protein